MSSTRNADELARLVDDEDAARDYLEAAVCTKVAVQLCQVRVDAGLSQQELANRLGTTQSAVSRTEHDDQGAISLRRLVRWAFACNRLPQGLDMMHVDSFLGLAQEAISGKDVLHLLPAYDDTPVVPYRSLTQTVCVPATYDGNVLASEEWTASDPATPGQDPAGVRLPRQFNDGTSNTLEPASTEGDKEKVA